MIIRLAKLLDMQAIWDFQDRECINRPQSQFWGDNVWENSILNKQILMAFDGKENVLGFVRFLQDDKKFHLLYIHVAKHMRDKKIGGKLFESVLAIADITHLTTRLSVSPANIVANTLYEKFGFVAQISDDPETEGLSVGMERQPFAHIMPKP